MIYRIILSLFLCFISHSAQAGIYKTFTTCEEALCFHWWPILPEIEGWHQDEKASYHHKANAVAPDGFTFSNAEAVIYAKALYKPRIPETKTLDMLIADDHADFLRSDASIIITETTPLTTGDGKKMKSFTFFPGESGNWEKVSYGEEGDFYLIFTISSRTETGYKKNLPIYEQLIWHYKE